MRLKLFCSNTINSSVAAVIGGLKRNRESDGGARHIFITADRFTLSVEKEIFELLDLFGAADIDVVSFKRLAMKILKNTEGLLSDEGAVLVLKKVVDKTERLSHYAKAAKHYTFAKEAYKAINMIRNSGYGGADLEGLELEGKLKSKIDDICLLYKGFMEELNKNYDGTGLLERFAKAVSASEEIKNAHIYIGGFFRFSAKERDIIRELIKNARSVSVALIPTNNGYNDEIYPKDALYMLKALADELGIKAETEESYQLLREPFRTVNSYLFSYTGQRAPKSDGVVLYKEDNVYDEINGIASEIRRLVRREGYRYNQIAIVNYEPKYDGLISDIFARYEIPHFLDIKYKLKDTLSAGFLFLLLEAVIYNFRADKMIRLIKSAALGLSIDEQCVFENYVLKYNISFKGFENPFLNSEAAEKARASAVELLSLFQKRGKISDYVSACVSALKTPTAADGFLSALEKLKDEELLYKSNLQAYENLLNILKETESVLGGEPADAEEFLDILKSAVGAVEISLIPQFADSVFVGSVRDSRFNDIKALFIMSATEEALSSMYEKGALITDTDADILNERGIRLYPLPADSVNEAAFLTADLMTKAERLYAGYSVSPPCGERNTESGLLKELSYMLDKKPKSLAARFDLSRVSSAEEIEDAAASQDNAYFKYLYFLNKESENAETVSQNMDILYASLSADKRAAVDKILKKGKKEVKPELSDFLKKDSDGGVYLASVTEIENYYGCPYRHYLTFCQQLKVREEPELQANDIGLIFHEAFKIYFERTLGKLDAMTDEEIKAEAEKATAEAYTEKSRFVSLVAALENSIKNRCVKALEEVTKNIQNSEYKPAHVEAGFGYKNSVFPAVNVETEGERFKFRGRIDRVDAYGERAAVVDLKTGGAVIDLTDIYYGTNLQPFIYLKAVSERYTEPSAAFYLPVTDKFSGEGDSYRMNGFILNYPNAVADFDGSIKARAQESKTKVSSPHIPIDMKYTKKNGLNITDKTSAYMLDGGTFDSLIKYSEDMLKSALSAIKEGDIEKKPLKYSYKSPCISCIYEKICLGEGEAAAREKAEVTPLHIMTKRKKEEEDSDE